MDKGRIDRIEGSRANIYWSDTRALSPNCSSAAELQQPHFMLKKQPRSCFLMIIHHSAAGAASAAGVRSRAAKRPSRKAVWRCRQHDGRRWCASWTSCTALRRCCLLPRPPRGSPCTAPRLRRPRRCWVCAPPDQRRRGAPTQARWLGRRGHRARPVGASALRCQHVEGSGKQRVASAVKPSGSWRHGARAKECLQTVEQAHNRGLGRKWWSHLGRPEAGPERERRRGGNRIELGTPNACGPRHSGARSAGRPPS
jgi:hypothetical protein